MALETGTFIDDLVATNPPGPDNVSQGDDHLRLVKSVLKATLPNADRAWRFPEVDAARTASETLTATDENKVVRVDASTGTKTITLPLGSGLDDGWRVTVMKIDASSNSVLIAPQGGDQLNGSTGSRTIDQRWGFEVYVWTGSDYILVGASAGAQTLGAPSGTRMVFQQTTAPTGWTKETSTAYNNVGLRFVTGTVSGAGTVAFTSVFNAASGSTVLTEANLAAHRHLVLHASAPTDNSENLPTSGESAAQKWDPASGSDRKYSTYGVAGEPTVGRTNEAGSGTGHTHTIPDLKYQDVIVAERD